MSTLAAKSTLKAGARQRIELPIIDLYGNPRQIGRQLGEARRGSVQKMLAEVKSNMLEARVPFGTGMSESEILQEVQQYIPNLESFAPTVAEELRGIAEGAGLRLEEAYLMQIPFAGCGLLLGSRRWRDPTNALNDYFAGTTGGCTTFSVTPEASKDGKTYVGQTCDFYPNYKDYWTVKRIKPTQGPQILACSPDGILTWGNGFNSSGIGVDDCVPRRGVRVVSLRSAGFVLS